MSTYEELSVILGVAIMQLFFNAISFPLGSEFSVEGEEYMKRISMQPLIPIVISFIISESILLYYEWKEYLDMGVAQWVTIIVALVGVAGGIWMQVIQLKKDVQKMEDIKEKCIGLRTGHRDLSAEHKDLSAEHKELSAEHKELSAEHKDLSREHKDLSNKIDIKTEKLDEKLTDIIMIQKTEKARREEASKRIPDAAKFIKESQGMFDTIYKLNRNIDELKQENKELKVEISRLNNKLHEQKMPDMDKSIDEAVSEEMLNNQDMSQENDEPSMSR